MKKTLAILLTLVRFVALAPAATVAVTVVHRPLKQPPLHRQQTAATVETTTETEGVTVILSKVPMVEDAVLPRHLA